MCSQARSGAVRLSSLFDEHDDLILIHNMGVSCPLCTLWADGYNGIHQHVVRRAAFAVTSPDGPEVQQKIASSRGMGFSDCQPRGHGIRCGHGLPQRGRKLVTRRLGIPALEPRQDRAGVRYVLLARR